MIGNGRVLALAIALAALTACSPDATNPRYRPQLDEVPLEDPPPPPPVAPGPLPAAYVSVVSTACMNAGFDEGTIYFIPGCAAADDGFDDEVAEFSFSSRAFVVDTQPQNQNIFWVYEIRYSSTGAGRRLVAIGPIGADLHYETGTFAVKLVRELQGITTLGYVGWCPVGLELDACRAYSEAQGNRHDEPQLCIWNPTVAAGGSRDAWCVSQRQPDPIFVTNLLPVAALSASHTNDCGEVPCSWWNFDATGSSDPDGGVARFVWRFAGPYTFSDSSSSGFFQLLGPPYLIGLQTIRVLIRDAQGGTDMAYEEVFVSW